LFEGRFWYLADLENMGATVEILNPHQALIIGPAKLKGTYVTTKDLRWGGALLLAWAIAEWQTFIMNENIILRGYENIVKKLKSIGVKIEKK
jgi:UDP-N-acetylglucosamine 1-carboxyvinyltransferase